MNRDNAFSISGGAEKSARAEAVIRRLFDNTENADLAITRSQVHLELSRSPAEESDDAEEALDEVVIRLRKQVIRGQNRRQRDYLRRIMDNDINFGIGPAGTGKTFLAVAAAVNAKTNVSS